MREADARETEELAGADAVRDLETADADSIQQSAAEAAAIAADETIDLTDANEFPINPASTAAGALAILNAVAAVTKTEDENAAHTNLEAEGSTTAGVPNNLSPEEAGSNRVPLGSDDSEPDEFDSDESYDAANLGIIPLPPDLIDELVEREAKRLEAEAEIAKLEEELKKLFADDYQTKLKWLYPKAYELHAFLQRAQSEGGFHKFSVGELTQIQLLLLRPRIRSDLAQINPLYAFVPIESQLAKLGFFPVKPNKRNEDPVADYLAKSGKHILLGDYSDEGPTALSITVSVGAGIFGVDAPMDARDFAASAQKGDGWGMVLNGIGFIPLIGVVKNLKYLKHTDEAADVVDAGKKASKLADSSADAAKNTKRFEDSVTSEMRIANRAKQLRNATRKVKLVEPINKLHKNFDKHAAAFGIVGKPNRANLAKFSEALQKHIDSANTKSFTGTYRGNPVVHHVDPATGLNAITDLQGTFISAWKLNPDQLWNVLNRSSL